jgi:hypothetical protein
MPLKSVFARLEDPRRGSARRHDLCEMILIALSRGCVARMAGWMWLEMGRRQRSLAQEVPEARARNGFARHVQPGLSVAGRARVRGLFPGHGFPSPPERGEGQGEGGGESIRSVATLILLR